MGSTSSGVFCLAASGRIFFLTSEKKLGPLTVILNSLPEIPPSRWVAAELEQSLEILFFPSLGLQVDLSNAETWQPPPLPPVKTTGEVRREHIQALACELLRSGRETILLPILRWLVNPSLRIVTPFISRFDWMERRGELFQAIHINEPRRAAKVLHPFFGMGTGTSATTVLPSFICWRICFIVSPHNDYIPLLSAS